MMTDLVKTDLFGGAIKANFPKGFIDAAYVIECQPNFGSVPTNLDLATSVKFLTPKRSTYLPTQMIALS